MRINPINVGLTTNVNKSRSKISTDPTLQQPIATDTVEFKAVPNYAKEYNRIFWKAAKAPGSIISRSIHRNHENFNYIDGLYKSLGRELKNFPPALLSKNFHYVYENFIQNGKIAELYRLKYQLGLQPGDHEFLVGDANKPYLFLTNIGKYEGVFSDPGHHQIVLEFGSGNLDTYEDEKTYLYFSTDIKKGVAYGISTPGGVSGRFQFYDFSHAKEYQFKSFSKPDFFPVSYLEYLNPDNSHNFWKEFLGKY